MKLSTKVNSTNGRRTAHSAVTKTRPVPPVTPVTPQGDPLMEGEAGNVSGKERKESVQFPQIMLKKVS